MRASGRLTWKLSLDNFWVKMSTALAPTKGERTAGRILDAAEELFAERGYEAASLREIARRAGLQQPGLYNHFASKRDLYAAVLDRALAPMAEAMRTKAREARDLRDFELLPAVMTDLLLEHPKMSALFQQALHGEASPGQELMRDWLDRLLKQGIATLRGARPGRAERAELALQIVAMFNVTTGYFLSQRALDSLGAGDLADPANIARQKALVGRIARAIARG